MSVGRNAARWPGICRAAGLTLALATSQTAQAQVYRTTIHVKPTHAAPGEVFHVTGESYCEIMFGTLYYTDFSGRQQMAAGHDRHAEFSQATQTNHYAMDIRVPPDADPGQAASVQTEPECGTAEEGFPPSDLVHLTVDPARPRLVTSPAGVQRGQTLTVRGSGCYGSRTATVPLRVRWPGSGLDLDARRSADTFTATVTIPASAGLGAGTVTLTEAADCPGSTLPALGGFQIVAAPVVTSPPGPPSSSATGSPTASATSSRMPDPTPPPAVSPSTSPHANTGSTRPARPVAAAVGLVVGVAALAVVLVLLRRRRLAVGVG